MICNACPRKCNTDRSAARGFCNSGEGFSLSRAALHYGEEPCISGENGSGAVFFSGCNLRCAFCQNYEISHKCRGIAVSDEGIVEIFERLINQGANNINLVNPTHYAERLSRVLSQWKSPVPIVYNSSGYESVNTLKMLDGLIDIYLPDFKYSRSDKAQKYSKAFDYPATALDAIKEMRRQVGEDLIADNGIMKKGLIIRHLILPSNTNSSKEILDIIKQNFNNTYVSIMAQYTPYGELDELPELRRRITQREYDKVVDYALSLGLDKLFIQELSSADKAFIPDFDFTGIL